MKDTGGSDASGEGHPDFYGRLLDHLSDGVYFADATRRILYWNHGAEVITGYTREEVVGSHCWDNILVHVDDAGNSMCRGSCPVSRAVRSGSAQVTEAWVKHKKGHRLPVAITCIPMRDEDGEIIGAAEVFRDNTASRGLIARLKELEESAIVDKITGLYNRRHMEQVLDAKLEEVRRYGRSLGVVFLDLDGFKRVNDTEGHGLGDQVLGSVGRTLLHGARQSDTPGRWGGDEFVVVADNTDEAELNALSDRIRGLVASSEPAVGRVGRITVSVGATIAGASDSVETVVGRADGLMYKSKAAGGDRATMG